MFRQKLNPKFSVKKAHKMQQQLSQKLSFSDTLPDNIQYIAGVDIAYANDVSIGAAVVLDFETQNVVESQVAHIKTCCPYVPTLLSFREIPPAVLVVRKLQVVPDVFLVDGQGFAHPYGLGFASHLGLILDMPTVGVAKSRLYGRADKTSGSEQVRFLKEKGKVVGAEVTTRQKVKPVYVSVGHKVSLERAITLVLDCARKYRLPEPTRKAHMLADKERKEMKRLCYQYPNRGSLLKTTFFQKKFRTTQLFTKRYGNQ